MYVYNIYVKSYMCIPIYGKNILTVQTVKKVKGKSL